MNRKFLFNTIFYTILIALPLVAGEFLFRYFIFSNNSPFKELKDPGKYARFTSDDYWKLYYQFGGYFGPPEHPHHLLGWVGFFHSNDYLHTDFIPSTGKRPVLIYGDSFIMCAHDSIKCFQDILNADTSFNKKHILLNYGVGGYGLDQEYLLYRQTVSLYQNPFVVFSIMPCDIDRALLSVRTGQKPYFIEEGDSLRLCGVPIDSVPSDFFEKHPPEIRSYLWNRLINSKLNPFYDQAEISDDMKRKILRLNKKIILNSWEDIKMKGCDYVYVIFDELWTEGGSWRTDSLLKFFTEQKIPFIYTKDLIDKDSVYKTFAFNRYILAGDGHPTSYYNKLVCDALQKYIEQHSKHPARLQDVRTLIPEVPSIEYYEHNIRRTPDWLESVRKKAEARGISLDTMIRMDARWLQDEERKKR